MELNDVETAILSLSVKLDRIEDKVSVIMSIFNSATKRQKQEYQEKFRVMRDAITDELLEIEDITEQSDDIVNVRGVVNECAAKIGKLLTEGF